MSEPANSDKWVRWLRRLNFFVLFAMVTLRMCGYILDHRRAQQGGPPSGGETSGDQIPFLEHSEAYRWCYQAQMVPLAQLLGIPLNSRPTDAQLKMLKAELEARCGHLDN